MKRFSIFALFLISTVFNAKAQIKWDGGGGDNLWNTAANWVGDIVPAATDDVLLNNSIVAGSYTVNLPSGALTVALNSLTITPAGANNITLIIPATNTSATAFSATGSGDAVILNNGAVFINSSGGSGNTVSVATTSFFRINNGGHYIHRTNAAHATNIVARLSAVTGTELGEFEFDDPSGSLTLSLSGRTYGSLTLSAVTKGTVSYTGNGASILTIRGDLKINSGVTFNCGFSADIVVRGNYIQAASSVFTLQNSTNNNFVKLMGNLTSLGTFTKSGSGLPTLELNGTANQNISISSITNNVSFKINNTANVTLTSPLTLPYNLQLTSGKIKTTSTNLLTLIDNATSTGGSSTSFVEGPMKKIGDEDFTFPVGVGSIYAPIGLLAGAGNPLDEFTGEYIRTNPQGAYGTNYAAGIDHISFVEYWNVVRGASTTSQKKILLTATALSFCKDIISTFVSHFNGTQWTNETSTPNQTGTSGVFQLGTTTTNAVVASFSPFTLATNLSYGANPLPIKLLKFDAIKISSFKSILSWELASASSAAAKFEIEKSSDSRTFILLETINGNSTNRFYSVADNQLNKGTTFYRLKMTDEDGTSSYSKIVAVINNETGVLITSFWPNPVQSTINLSITLAKAEPLHFTISDISGKTIKQWDVNANQGSNTISATTESFSTGTYQLVVRANNSNAYYRFIKQ